MSASARHILNHGPVLAVLARTAFSAVRKAPRPSGPATFPGPQIERVMQPLPSDLIDDYLRFVGGDARAYRGQVPPHLFSQWAFPLAATAMSGLPYPMLKVVNGGCRMEVRGPIPRGEPLYVRARLEQVDDDGYRAAIKARVITGTAAQEELLVADFHALVPLKKKEGGGSREKPRVPDAAHEIGRRYLKRNAGLDFAKLTGDFNPIHWVGAYAKANGFRDVILHGFGTLALSAEALNKGLFAGDVSKLKALEVRFTRPLVLPHDVGFYTDADNGVYVGDAAGGPAYMTGKFETGDKR